MKLFIIGYVIFVCFCFGWGLHWAMSTYVSANDLLLGFKEKSEKKRKKIFWFLNQKEQQEYLDLEKTLLLCQEQYRYEGKMDKFKIKESIGRIEGLECLSNDRKKKRIEFNPA